MSRQPGCCRLSEDEHGWGLAGGTAPGSAAAEGRAWRYGRNVSDRATIKTPEQGRAAGQPVMRPSQLAAIMRPELPDLAREIIAEIRDKIPEYARPMNGPYGQALREGVQRALTSFFDSVADPAAPHE